MNYQSTAPQLKFAVQSLPRAHQLSTFAILAVVALLCAAGPATAQTASPEIKAKEDRDPASGEVVIINRGKQDKGAPNNAYAPIKLKPLPDNYTGQGDTSSTSDTAGSAAQTAPERSTSPPKPTRVTRPSDDAAPSRSLSDATRTPPGTASSVTSAPSADTSDDAASAPPLPAINTEPRSQSARLRQFPATQLRENDPPPANDADPDQARETERDEAAPTRAGPDEQRSAREQQQRDEPDRQTLAERRRADAERIARARGIYNRGTGGRGDVVTERQGGRPWQACRQFARRCQDGFERACDRWQQRCGR